MYVAPGSARVGSPTPPPSQPHAGPIYKSLAGAGFKLKSLANTFLSMLCHGRLVLLNGHPASLSVYGPWT